VCNPLVIVLSSVELQYLTLTGLLSSCELQTHAFAIAPHHGDHLTTRDVTFQGHTATLLQLHFRLYLYAAHRAEIDQLASTLRATTEAQPACHFIQQVAGGLSSPADRQGITEHVLDAGVEQFNYMTYL